MVINGSELRIEASMGIAVCPDDGRDAATLMKNADAAMYHAKSEGRGQFQFYSEELNQAAVTLMRLSTELKLALERDEFVLYYQPKVCASSLRIVGAEALLRWEHPERGHLGPGAFLPAAETLGRMNAIGDWTLRAASRQLSEWKSAGRSTVRVSVNVVASQLQQGDIVGQVRGALSEHGLEGKDLELEVTESMLISRVDETIATLETLRALGVAISLDDYGTGYSSMSYMKRLPIDKLKIDRSFIIDLADNDIDRAIVTSTIELARSRNMLVVAEGVEDDEQLELLQRYGCDEIQGYYFSKPLPAEEFIDLVGRGAFAEERVHDAVVTVG